MKKRVKKTKISFDEEVVTRNDAKEVIQEEAKRQNSAKRTRTPDFEAENPSENEVKQAKKKRKQSLEVPKPATEPPATQIKEAKESNRAIKRKKHAKLQEEKKLKTELELQQKALNYLSKWKHNNSEWKFEKLRQVWLQQNLLDRAKVPEQFWDTVLQYFGGSKGHSRQVVLEMCLKLIENDEKVSEEDRSEDYEVRLRRARDVVQNLE